jgi:hypothetical protein
LRDECTTGVTICGARSFVKKATTPVLFGTNRDISSGVHHKGTHKHITLKFNQGDINHDYRKTTYMDISTIYYDIDMERDKYI